MSRGNLRKVSAIFEAFDRDKDVRLNKAELEALIQQCNPTVSFSEVQLQAIIDEVNNGDSNPVLAACFGSAKRSSHRLMA